MHFKDYLLDLFGWAGSLLQHMGSLLFLVRMWDLFPKLGIEPRPPSLRAWSLSHWKYQRGSPSPLNARQCDLVILLYQMVDSTLEYGLALVTLL